MRGRPKAALVLTEQEREELVALTLRRKTAQALAQRARIVLACAEGPGQGFGYCATWGRESQCIPEGQGDHMFTLLGKRL